MDPDIADILDRHPTPEHIDALFDRAARLTVDRDAAAPRWTTDGGPLGKPDGETGSPVTLSHHGRNV